MSLISGFAIYGIIWWLVLFMVLPFGVRTSSEAGEEAIDGNAESAPARPLMLRKIVATSLVALAIWSVVFVVMEYQLVTLDNIPFLPNFEDRP